MPLQTLLPLPAYHQESCAAGSGGVEGCRQCVDACPHGALRTRSGPAGTTVEVDAGPCQRCGACTAVCPTASLERAFLPADELRELVLEAVGAGRPIAFIGDHHHEMIEVATSAGWSVVGLPSVLIVDPVVLVTARRAGAPAVAVLGCRDCHHGSLQLIEAAVEVTAALTGRAGSNLVADVDAPGTAAALVDMLASAPPPRSVVPALPGVRRGATSRQALSDLLLAIDAPMGDASVVGFGHVEVDADACTLCGACARSCPTGTLELTDGALTVRDIDCVQCGLCLAACPEGVVAVPTATAKALLARRELVADEIVPCSVCGGPHLPARLLARAREVVGGSGRPPTRASRQIDRCPSCRTIAPDGLRSSVDGRPAPVGVPQVDRRAFLVGSAASVGGVLGMVAVGVDPGSPAAAAVAEPEPARLGMVIDIRRCIGCHACTAVCKAENHVPLDVNRDWVEEYVQGEYPEARVVFVPKLCNHCDDPGCLRACPTGAIFKRADGIVDLDHSMCIGCRACNQACPYGCTFVDPVRRTADKCNLCSHRVDEGLNPACVDVCPSQCRVFGDLADPESAPSRLRADQPTTVLRPELGLGPNVHYVGLPSDPGRPTSATTVGYGRA